MDGAFPTGNLIFDASGHPYGTTLAGGDSMCPPGNIGCGTAFELTPAVDGTWRETMLHSFNGKDDGREI
jgi:hypothetical protein